MRKKYDNQQNVNINNYFINLITEKYILPSLFLLTLVFSSILLGFESVARLFQEYNLVDFLYFLSMNVLISIASVSIYHTIKTCVFGYQQIAKRQYTVLQLTCVNKMKSGLTCRCQLSDGRVYKLYDRDQYESVQVGQSCDLIIITNEYGAKLWEIVVGNNKKENTKGH